MDNIDWRGETNTAFSLGAGGRINSYLYSGVGRKWRSSHSGGDAVGQGGSTLQNSHGGYTFNAITQIAQSYQGGRECCVFKNIMVRGKNSSSAWMDRHTGLCSTLVYRVITVEALRKVSHLYVVLHKSV